MRNPAVARLGILCLLVPLVSFTLITTPAVSRSAADDALVVHEWGTFTSVRNKDGTALLWRPLSFESDLPKFVYSIDKGRTWKSNSLTSRTKRAQSATVRIETPVLSFC